MKASNLSVQGSIILGALIIALSNLIGTGVIKLQGVTVGNSTAAPSAGTQTGAVPTTPPATKVPGITAGGLQTLGDNNAKVLVVEWADFQCPFCKQWFDSVESSLKKDYIDTGKVKFAFRNFDFLGQESIDSANAAWCANDQGKFWDYHDYLYNHQGQENSGTFSKDNLKKFAATLGLDTTKFNSCVDSDTHAKDVSDDKDAGTKVGVTGTPTVYVNGTQIVGAQPYSTLKTAIDDALAGK